METRTLCWMRSLKSIPFFWRFGMHALLRSGIVFCLAALVSGPAFPTKLPAQGGNVVVSGRVIARDGSSVANASIEIRPANTKEAQTVPLVRDGTFRFSISPTARAVTITVTTTRFENFSITIPVQSGSDELRIPDVVLIPKAQVLPQVRAVAQRPRPSREEGPPAPGPGERSLSLDPALVLAGDLSGDPAYAMSGLAGIQVVESTNGGPPQISIAGLSSGLNRTTLNGSVAPGKPPRDGAILQVLLNSYDATRASGSLVTNWSLLSGSFTPVRRLHATLSVPETQWTTAEGKDVGARILSPTLSGNIAGQGKSPVRFVNTSFQLAMQSATVPSLLSASSRSVIALGFAPESIDRLRRGLSSLGIPVDGNARLTRRSSQASVYSRIDLTGNAVATALSNLDGSISAAGPGRTGDVGYVVVGGSVANTQTPGIAATVLPNYRTATSAASGTVQGVWSHFGNSGFLTESRIAVSTNRARVEPGNTLPGASVLFGSIGFDQLATAGIAQLGGTGGSAGTSRGLVIHGMNETRWNTQNARHEYKVAVESSKERLNTARDPGSGAFDFQSLADYLANTPSTFTRRLDAVQSEYTAVRAAVGLGDTYRRSRYVSVQYGVRIEREEISSDAPRSVLVDSLFARDARSLPAWTAFSPMLGFTWILDRDAYGFPNYSHRLSGGIRDYRGSLPLASLATRPDRLGQLGEPLVLRCIGATTPRPDWSGYASGAVAAPRQCSAGNSGSALAQSVSDADLFSPDFTIGHSWRADLAFDYSFPGDVFTTLHGMLAANSAQSLPFDLNFSAVERGRLASEAMRPLFVEPNNIVPATGSLNSSDSRRFTQFGMVAEHRSTGAGRAQTIGITLARRPSFSFYSNGIQTPISFDYTYADIRTQSNGFAGTTSRDPRSIEWDRNAFSRHTILLSGAVRVPDVVTAAFGLQLRSGVGFTPIVASDINGDGLTNDRAFVFDANASSSSYVSGLNELLNTLSRGVRGCLAAQVGTVAQANSCGGPWSATANASLTVDSYRIGLQNRGSVRFVLSNLAAGADLLLHGATNTRGWGQPTYPDPILFYVRGFDASTNRFRYATNPRFGSASAFRAAFATPFRLSVDVSVDVGRSQERRMMEQRLNPRNPETPLTREEIVDRLAWRGPELFARVVALADSLRLSSAQVDSLTAWSKRHSAFRDSVYQALAVFLWAQRGVYSSADVQRRWRDAISAVRWDEWNFREPLMRLLERAQADAVLSERGPAVSRLLLMDRKEAARFLARWYLGPG